MEIEIGLKTIFPDFVVILDVDFKRELKRFSYRHGDLLKYYDEQFSKLFHNNLKILDIVPGSLVLFCKLQRNLPEALDVVAKNHFALPIRHKKSQTARISSVNCLADGAIHALRSESEVLQLEERLILTKLQTLPESTNPQYVHTERMRYLSEEADPYYSFVEAMKSTEFDVPLSALEIIPPIWREKLSDLAEKLKTNNMSPEDWTALSLVRTTRRKAILSWQGYLKEKPRFDLAAQAISLQQQKTDFDQAEFAALSSPDSNPSEVKNQVKKNKLLHSFWEMQRLLALIPVYRTQARDISEIVSYFQENGLEASNGELTLLSLLPPKDRCRVWEELWNKYPSSEIVYYKYALALLKSNREGQAMKMLQMAVATKVITLEKSNEWKQAFTSIKEATELGHVPPSAKDCQQTLNLLRTTFTASSHLNFYHILVSYCNQQVRE